MVTYEGLGNHSDPLKPISSGKTTVQIQHFFSPSVQSVSHKDLANPGFKTFWQIDKKKQQRKTET